MNADMPIGLTVIEKLLGLILIIVGIMVTLHSTNPPPGEISQFSGIFTILGIVILAAGILLTIAKTK